MDPNEIGSRLGMLIKAMKLKQYQFTEKFGISANSLDRYKIMRVSRPSIHGQIDRCRSECELALEGEGSMFILAPWELGDDIRTTRKSRLWMANRS